MKLKCDWDCCTHYNAETGCCDNPDEVVLSTTEAVINGEPVELFDCKGFVSYEESEGS